MATEQQLKQRIHLDLAEACNILLTIRQLTPAEEQNAYTHAIELLAVKAGWLVDRCNIALGSPGVCGAQFEDWESA